MKVFYVMGKALSGELSCPCDRSCNPIALRMAKTPITLRMAKTRKSFGHSEHSECKRVKFEGGPSLWGMYCVCGGGGGHETF